MLPSISVKFTPSADTLLVVSTAMAFIVYLVLAGLECHHAATLHPYRVAIIFIVLCFVGYISYGNESVPAATSQSTSSSLPQCMPAQEATSTAPRSPRPESKSKRKVESELKVKPEPKSQQPEPVHNPDRKPQQTAPRPSSHPHFSPSAHRSGLFGLAPRSFAPSPVIQSKVAPEPRRQPPRARLNPPTPVSDVFTPNSQPSSSAPTDVMGECPAAPATTPPSQPTSAQSIPEPAMPQPLSLTPAQELIGRVRPPSPGLTPLRDAKRQRTLDSLPNLIGLATPGSHEVQSDALNTPLLGLGDLALPSCPSPVSEHPGSPILLDHPGSPMLLNNPGSPMLLDSPQLDVPSRPRSVPLPVSQHIHGPRVSIAEMIRLRIDFDDFTLSTLPPQDVAMWGPGMGDMDVDGAEAARVSIEQDVEMAPRMVIEEDAEMDVLEQDAVMAC